MTSGVANSEGIRICEEGFFADSVNGLLKNGVWDLFIIVLFSVLNFGNHLLGQDA